MTMIAVTIARNEPYEMIAKVSTRCLEESTGIKPLIISEAPFESLAATHPAAWRMWLCEIFPNEDILYFDADWFCLNDWKPSSENRKNTFIACRDFLVGGDWPDQNGDFELFEGESTWTEPPQTARIRQDYIAEVSAFAKIVYDPEFWFNSGLMIFNSCSIHEFMQYAQALYKNDVGHHSDYFEQPSLVKAASDMQANIAYLPRKYNVLAAGRTVWPRNIIGLHVKNRRNQEFLSLIESGGINCRNDVRRYFFRT